MATVSAFQPATPAMIVGHGNGDESLPVDLGEPFALLGGDRLGPDGIPFMMMHEHQPDLLRWVRARCAAMLAAERPWFNGGTLILGGPPPGRAAPMRRAGFRVSSACPMPCST